MRVSSLACQKLKKIVSAQYQAAATSNVLKKLKVAAPASCERRRSSSTVMTDTSEVSLIRAMKSLPTAGMTILNACGRTMRRCVCQPLRPIAQAASFWPLGTAWMPARKTSVR